MQIGGEEIAMTQKAKEYMSAEKASLQLGICPRIIRKLSISIPIYFLPQIADSKSIIESSQKYRNINDTVWNNASASVIC